MSAWITVANSTTPNEPGWYPTLSDWGTATLHPGARLWLGAKWAGTCSENIVAFSLQRFAKSQEAAIRAYQLYDPPTEASISNIAEGEDHLAEAA